MQHHRFQRPPQYPVSTPTISMHNATAARAAPSTAASDRRLAAGVLVSLLLHGLVLSLQFGIPGLRPGWAGR